MIVAGPQGNPMLKIHAAGVCACVALIASGYIFGLKPLMEGPPPAVDLNGEIDEAREKLSDSMTHLERQNSDLVEAQLLADEQTVELSPASTLNTRLASLSELAQGYDLSISGTQIDPLDQSSAYAFIPIRMTGEGAYREVLDFLGALRTRFPDMGMQRFSLSRDSLAGGARFEIVFSWFVTPPQSAQVGD